MSSIQCRCQGVLGLEVERGERERGDGSDRSHHCHEETNGLPDDVIWRIFGKQKSIDFYKENNRFTNY